MSFFLLLQGWILQIYKPETRGISHKPSCLPKHYLPKPVFTIAVTMQLSYPPASFPGGLFGGETCSVVRDTFWDKAMQFECILLLNITISL